MASPFDLAAADPEVLLRPAVEGSRNVYRACAAAGTVTRVVTTSSFATIVFGAAGKRGGVLAPLIIGPRGRTRPHHRSDAVHGCGGHTSF